jgi:hypothetical protein
MSQFKSLSNKVADIQLNQNSSLMNAASGTAPSKYIPSSSVSSTKNILPINDKRVLDLHTRVFQNIGTFVKPANHKNPVPMFRVYR